MPADHLLTDMRSKNNRFFCLCREKQNDPISSTTSGLYVRNNWMRSGGLRVGNDYMIGNELSLHQRH